MKIANILTMALSSHMARAGQNLSAPDDETNLLQMGFMDDAMPVSRVFPLPAHSAIGADVWMSDCHPQPGQERNERPCQNCIDISDPGVFPERKATWSGSLDEGREAVEWGAGHTCCQKLNAKQLSQQPLCGICMRAKGGTDSDPEVALNGAWGFNPKCAKVYCKAADLRFEITDAYMAELARQCGGMQDLTYSDNAGSPDLKEPAVGWFSEEFQRTPNAAGKIYGSCFDPAKPRPEVFMAVVANNPRKVDIDIIFKANADNLYKLKGHITGTGSSSKQCSKTVCAMKGDGEKCLLGGSTTTSGPYGGDVQCGGIVAEDYTEERLRRRRGGFNRAIAGMVFTNDEREPHRLDIIALKRQVEKGLKPARTCWHEESTPSPAQVIADVAAEWETVSASQRARSAIQNLQASSADPVELS